MSVTREDVRHIAALARLRFGEEEEGRMADELSRILGYVEQLRGLDTEGVPPMTHVLGLENVLRPDEVAPRIAREDALRNAPDADGEHVRVPKVID